ncbi:MAG: LuxR C-terminal-related transcriptional regulator [Crocinitomicaceae bacterium]
MSSQILTTKLYTPTTRSQTVSRTHLIDRLNQGLQARLTLICAPAGFGKTTLISEWLSQSDHPSAWLSLDEQDNEPTRFLTYVIAALQTIEPHIGDDLLKLLQSPQPPTIDTLLIPLINALATMPETFILVLDDYHVLDTQEIDAALAFLLDNLPPKMHIIITTREDPQIPLAKYRARAELTELRADDLRFTNTEMQAFLNQIMGLDLSTDAISALETRTEGWIASLQMVAISLQGQSDKTQFIDAFTGSHRYIMDYLLEEVLNQQSQEIRAFLLQTSILKRLNADLCDAVTQTNDSQLVLEQLEKGNLFIIPLDNTRQWYRYHHLFADTLQARLNREAPESIAIIHQRVAKWYEDNGYVLDAIYHAFLADDYEHVVHLLELVWADLDLSYHAGPWFKWAKRLPQEIILARPLLCLGFAWSLVSEGDFVSGEPYLDVAEKYVNHYRTNNEEPDHLHWHMVAAGSLSARAFIALAHHEIDQAIDYAEESLTHSIDPMKTSHRQASAVLGFSLWAKGDLKAADEIFENFLTRTNYLEVGVIPYIADLRVELGNMQGAKHIFEEGLNRIEQSSPYIETELYRRFAELHLDLGGWDEFKNYLALTKAIGENFAPLRWEQRYYVTQSQYLALIGDYDMALDNLDLAEKKYLPTAMPSIRPIIAQKARIWLMQGRLDEVKYWAKQQGIAQADYHYLKEYEHITLARLYSEQYRQSHADDVYKQASVLLAQLLSEAESGARVRSMIEILILQAELGALSNDLESALSILNQALDMAAPQGYIFLFAIEGERLKPLLQQSNHAYARHLLAVLSDVSTTAKTKQPTGSLDALSERELEVLTLIADGLSNREISERLFIALDTVKGHNRSIYQKLQVRRRTEAVSRARELGLI